MKTYSIVSRSYYNINNIPIPMIHRLETSSSETYIIKSRISRTIQYRTKTSLLPMEPVCSWWERNKIIRTGVVPTGETLSRTSSSRCTGMGGIHTMYNFSPTHLSIPGVCKYVDGRCAAPLKQNARSSGIQLRFFIADNQ